MNKLDKAYTDLLQDIIDNGYQKGDRTGTGTISVFGRQIRHKMSEGFPLLTTKKMAFKTMATELIWFLRGDTNIKFLLDNNCHIWDGDAYANYSKKSQTKIVKNDDGTVTHISPASHYNFLSKEEFINKIKTDAEFAKKWGELGPIYGYQWRNCDGDAYQSYLKEHSKNPNETAGLKNGIPFNKSEFIAIIQTSNAFAKKWRAFDEDASGGIDQIANLIRDLKTNPDSRRLMVSAWNVGELDQMTLPPCHYGFQVYTRELSLDERLRLVNYDKEKFNSIDEWINWYNKEPNEFYYMGINYTKDTALTDLGIPTRAISLMWNQRSVDTFLGLPFNIASYGLLLEIIAKSVNMVPDELIGNLGDTHLYSNHIEQAKEQIGRELRTDERVCKVYENNKLDTSLLKDGMSNTELEAICDLFDIPKRTREPYPLPKLNINTEFWPYEGGSCGEGPIDAVSVFNSFKDDNFCRCLLEEDIQLSNYQYHTSIKAPLSN